MWAIWTTIVFLVVALAAAMTVGWKRHAAQMAPVRVKIEGSTCYPKVKR
ncbi:hypothetical protein [Maritimibacter sp. HL-12]|nr:hypothetical protein [Maritimibacter sp. HL-12]SMH56721.1 hypothetical protein SAMN05661107_3300 [Maritimibacter sp. HL-12]